MSKFWIQGCLR